jgi:integrase
MGNILKSGVRILRPQELRKLIDAIPKNEYKEKFEALLYTGARYVEIQRIYKNPTSFQGNSIHITPDMSKKRKMKYTERYIRLNPQGQRAVMYMLRSRKPYPRNSAWNENLKRWAKRAGIDDQGICPKTTRKTWESYLVTSYSQSLEYIFLSQGHHTLTALKFYLMIPFTDEEKKEIKYFTDGWI